MPSVLFLIFVLVLCFRLSPAVLPAPLDLADHQPAGGHPSPHCQRLVPLVISGPVLRSRSCHLYGGAGADFLVGRNRELAPAGFSFRKTKLKSFVLIINMKSVLFKKTNMIPKRFLLITKFIRAIKKIMSGAGVGSGTSDLRSRSKKWRLRNTASLYHELGTKIVF